MKKQEYCVVSEGCWGHRHELFGLLLVILAVVLTILTWSGLGIFGMFLAGIALCCHKHMHHSYMHCHSQDESMPVMAMEKAKPVVKKTVVKTKTKDKSENKSK